MKIIDLLNKIANGEEVPKKIKYKGIVREFDYEDKDYIGKNTYDYYLFHDILAAGTGDKMVTGINDEVEIIEDIPKEDILNYKDLLQQEINNENEILLSRLESDTKLDIIKNYITSEEAIDNFKTIESRDEWLKVHDFILDIIDNYKLQKENGEVIENIPKEDKKIEKLDVVLSDYLVDNIKENILAIQTKINEIIDKINGE